VEASLRAVKPIRYTDHASSRLDWERRAVQQRLIVAGQQVSKLFHDPLVVMGCHSGAP
jgi:hypothetical protein